MDYDALVIGGGIAGMESAISLGDMGYKVALVEKEPSIGGKMILLSKVFPTLDCASCISTPKMAGTASHKNIDLNVYSEVRNIRRSEEGSFLVTLYRKPRYVDFDLCTGCQECEKVCTVSVPDEYNFGLVARRVAHIAFPQAVPKKAVIDREGTSPCTFHCPANIKANGYISLARQGQFEEAFNLVLDDAPLVGSLGRACYSPCEKECTLAETDGAPHIRMIKRYIADWYYDRHPEPEYGPPEEKTGKKVAVIGSGPAGLSAAFFLAKKGHEVKILEARDIAGGMLRSELPRYRLPKETVDRDIMNITALGVKIETGVEVTSVRGLLDEGFDSVFVSVGANVAKSIGIEGEDHPGVLSGIRFLFDVTHGRKHDLKGKRALVIGGGNVAIDVARTAARLGASEVRMMCLEKREEMPASEEEIEDAVREKVIIEAGLGPEKVIVSEDRITGVETVACLSIFDGEGKFSPKFDSRKRSVLPCDVVFISIGQSSQTGFLEADGIELLRGGMIKADAETMVTSVDGIFAGGEVVTGPSMIVEAIGQGKRAAFYMDRFIRDGNVGGPRYDDRIEPVTKEQVLSRQKDFRPPHHVDVKQRDVEERVGDFSEIELPMSERETIESADNCLNCGICCECQQCVKACQAEAIDLYMKGEEVQIEVASVIVSTGYGLFPAHLMDRYGYGKFKNVITAMEMDRIIAPTRPYNHLLRPLDGKVPDNIAYVLCAGSRDHTTDNPICSRVCCMYSIKQAQLLLGALPIADVTLYYIDIRAFGKGYDEFYEQSRGMGVQFVKGKVAKIDETSEGNLILRYEDIDNGGKIMETEHDLVVLSTGFIPNPEFRELFSEEELRGDKWSFVEEPDEETNPARTSIEGVFVAGAAAGPMDIPDTILHSGAAAVQA
ncbi:MAG: FAD-dependent oxidoreductase, partial [Bacteroidales bacterium]|nr:FAD-dependent oxidoreductase [Candidatus Latescibacterota bacterium]